MQKKLNETMDNAYPINPKKSSGALGYLFYAYCATRLSDSIKINKIGNQ